MNNPLSRYGLRKPTKIEYLKRARGLPVPCAWGDGLREGQGQEEEERQQHGKRLKAESGPTDARETPPTTGSDTTDRATWICDGPVAGQQLELESTDKRLPIKRASLPVVIGQIRSVQRFFISRVGVEPFGNKYGCGPATEPNCSDQLSQNFYSRDQLGARRDIGRIGHHRWSVVRNSSNNIDHVGNSNCLLKSYFSQDFK